MIAGMLSVRRELLVVLMLCVIGLMGCQEATHAPAAGPQLSRDQLIAQINANNQSLSSLWARISLDAEIRNPDTGKRQTIYAGDGALMFLAPSNLRLRAIKDTMLVLDLGINADRFWLIAPAPGPDQMWWGYVRDAAYASQEIPIAPRDLLDVLALRPISTEGENPPVLRFDSAGQTYTLVWFRNGRNRDLIAREVSYDRQTLHPVRVMLYDPAGKLTLQADLSAHAPVEGSAKPEPVVARHITLYATATKSTAELRLRNVAATHNGVPNAASFGYPAVIPVANVKQIP